VNINKGVHDMTTKNDKTGMTSDESFAPKKKLGLKKFQRFDPTKARDGVPHHIVDENGNDYGIWITRLFDLHNKMLKVENDRYERQHANDPQAKGKHGTLYAFVRVCLVGWEGVPDEDGNDAPFDAELAFDHLTDEDSLWLANELIARSQDVTRYRAVTPAATQEDDSGN
jgi:hypothetical protein